MGTTECRQNLKKQNKNIIYFIHAVLLKQASKL